MNAQELLTQMTLDEKIGQMFMLAFAKNRLDEAHVLFEKYFVGGSYISNDNIPTPQAATALTSDLQGYAAKTRLKIPLLLGVDQEGAWGVMVPASCTGPGNMALGATGRPNDAYQVYKVIGQELRAVGLNAVYAPCADCNSNPHNSVIGMRSFGEKPRLVGAMTAAALKGMQDGGVIPTIKHFPGHGDTTLDSHRGIPTVNRTRDELFAIDLYPFKQAIEAGAEVVMTSHIVFTALDAQSPATLSKTILQDVLRGQFGFTGVIVSDSMNMQAILKNYTQADSAIRAFNAGVDLLMLAEEHYSHNAEAYLQQQTTMIGAVKAAVERGELPIERVDDAARRVLTLKLKHFAFPADSRQPVSPEVVGSPANRQVELEAARHAVAVLRDESKHVPIATTKPIVLVNATTRSSYAILGATRGIGPNQTRAAFDYFADAMRHKYPQLREVSAEDVLDGDVAQLLKGNAMIVAVTENYPIPGVDFDQKSQPEVVRRLLEKARDRLVVVALRDPYELTVLPEVPTYVCAFSFRPCAAQAAAEVVAGEIVPTGRSPVSAPGVAALEMA